MEETSAIKNKRIAKNTLMLYFRMFITLIVGLYTSRVVLNTLGIEDYGIYDVVGGVVGMLGFLNSTIATGTQRFLTYHMGKGDRQKLQNTFTNAMNVHIIIGILVFILLETGGLWFVYNKLVIPPEKMDSAIWVFHCSAIACFIGIISTPYSAAIIANEKMGIYAYFSILDTALKLLAVYILMILPGDKLVIYAILILAIGFLMRFLYNYYCIRHFQECKYTFHFNLSTMKEMFSFSGWMFFGCITDLFSTQGVSILINIYAGSVYNASRAIATTVQGVLGSFSGNFMTSVNPQIVKSYASNDHRYMYRLVFSASKLSYYLTALFAIPFIIYSDYILAIWLKTVPPECGIFVKLILISLTIRALYSPIAQINQAAGKIKLYQMCISALFIIQFAAAYILLKSGFPAYSPFVAMAILSTIGLIVRLLVLKHDNQFPVNDYMKRVILPIIAVSIVTIPLPCIYSHITETNIINLIITTIISTVCLFCAIYTLGTNATEKEIIKDRCKSILSKIRHKQNSHA